MRHLEKPSLSPSQAHALYMSLIAEGDRRCIVLNELHDEIRKPDGKFAWMTEEIEADLEESFAVSRSIEADLTESRRTAGER